MIFRTFSKSFVTFRNARIALFGIVHVFMNPHARMLPMLQVDPKTRILFSSRVFSWGDFEAFLGTSYLDVTRFRAELGILDDDLEYHIDQIDQIRESLIENREKIESIERSKFWSYLPTDNFANCLNILLSDDLVRSCFENGICFDEFWKELNKNEKIFLLQLLKIVKESKKPFRFLDVLSFYLVPYFKDCNDIRFCTPALKTYVMGLKRTKVFTMMTKSNRFILYNPRNQEQLIEIKEPSISILHSKLQVTLISKDEPDNIVEFNVLDKDALQLWSQCFDIDNELVTSIKLLGYDTYPPMCFFDIIAEILSNNMLFVRALLDFRVVNIKHSTNIINSLLVLFLSKNMINKLIGFLCYSEIKSTSNENEILRGNSFLWVLIKIFEEKYFIKYFENIVEPFLNVLNSSPPLNIKDPKNCKISELIEFIYLFISRILSSRINIPPQLSHIAYFLKNATIATFNTKRAVINSLSSLFGLRFIFSNIVAKFPDDGGTVFQFTQILQRIFGMNLIDIEKMPHLACINNILINSFPKISDFLISLADIDINTVKYDKPNSSEILNSVYTIISCILQKYDQFESNYKKLKVNKNERQFVCSWCIENLLINAFKVNF